MIYGIQFPTCEHTQYLGPMKETLTTIKLGFHCQIQDYLGHFLDSLDSFFISLDI